MDDRSCGVRVVEKGEILINGKNPGEFVERSLRGVAAVAQGLPNSLGVVKNAQLGGRVGLWMPKQKGTEVAHFGVDVLKGAEAIGMHDGHCRVG